MSKTIDTLIRSCTFCGKEVDEGRSDRRLHYECEKEAAKVRSAVWYEERKETLRPVRVEYSRKYRRDNPTKRLLIGAKQRATEKDLPLDIDETDITIPATCPVLGVSMEVGTPYAPSLDRTIPELGYTKGNVMVISRKANAMKQNATPEELRSFAKWVHQTFPH